MAFTSPDDDTSPRSDCHLARYKSRLYRVSPALPPGETSFCLFDLRLILSYPMRRAPSTRTPASLPLALSTVAPARDGIALRVAASTDLPSEPDTQHEHGCFARKLQRPSPRSNVRSDSGVTFEDVSPCSDRGWSGQRGGPVLRRSVPRTMPVTALGTSDSSQLDTARISVSSSSPPPAAGHHQGTGVPRKSGRGNRTIPANLAIREPP